MSPEMQALLDAAKNPGAVDAAVKARVATKLAHSLSVTPSWWHSGAAKAFFVSALVAGGWLSASKLTTRTREVATLSISRTTAPEVTTIAVQRQDQAPKRIVSPALPTALRPVTPPFSVTRAKSARALVAKHLSEEHPVLATARDRLDEERRLLDNARFALLHHDAEASATQLARYDQEFARGVLAEERAALWVQAYAARGETSRARDAAHAFLTTYPDSVQRTAVLDVLQALHVSQTNADGNGAAPQ